VPPDHRSALAVRLITVEQHVAVVEAASGSFLQTPAWAKVKSDWDAESLGWFDGESLVGAGLVLYRRVPRTKRSLAYLPEGPVIDWNEYSCSAITAPLLEHLRGRKAFSVKMGPPVIARRWKAATVKAAVAEDGVRRLGEVPADDSSQVAADIIESLRSAGWRRKDSGVGFGDFQPKYVFQVPLDADVDDLLSRFNQLWRRNIRKAEKAGVKVRLGDTDDLDRFHEIYRETAARDGFTARPLAYFQRMWQAMRSEDPDRIRLYLAEHEGALLAATTWVRVGSHVWYSYGASTSAGREMRPSNAIQWQMLQDAKTSGAAVYDLRGISDTLDTDDPLFGLIQFKLGTGGEVLEFVGEWDYPLNKLWHAAFGLYMDRR
jgi:lipid II:glycine glycyltransferase (peptidoglycan interpeptide bridge formation enzyme)